ncbi:MAG: YgiQ family radical SAM protein, partial [Clostridia bacterium]|nr:YgiQ family radical SAM protein [Clostridia bacterium]
GFSCAVLAQPDYTSCQDFKRFGRPRLGFLVSAGNIDSMVAHYTAAKKRRSEDYYSPGCKAGKRPDRAVIVYCNRIREAYGDVPILIGGLEASLRRFAHYDYWDDKVRRSVLVDSRADILMYGMGERSVVRLAELLNKGVPVKKIRDVRGTAWLGKAGDEVFFPVAGNYKFLPELPEHVPEDAEETEARYPGYDYDQLKSDKTAYADAFRVQYNNHDSIHGKALVEYYGNRMLVVNPPQAPLEREELDRVYDLPYTRTWHPMYTSEGGVPAISEVRFSITHNRGCFGGCNFCALAFHQGRAVRSRSIQSVVEEAKLLTTLPDFKGYIHDIGGPTANFRKPACEKQLKDGVCPNKRCLFPKPCPNLEADHSEYIRLLKEVEAVPGIKKVFIRSGIRFDYMLADKNDAFFKKLVRDHVSGQLKVAPEHCAPNVLSHMGKPSIQVYDRFREKYERLNKECGLNQFLVPYLMSSHPGSTMDDAAELALYTKRIGLAPEQVQDFYPTPGTASTVMYYTGLDPFTGNAIYTATNYREKQLQRALLQWRKPENRRMIYEAMNYCTDVGKVMLQELVGENKRSEVRSKKYEGQPKNGHSGQNRTGGKRDGAAAG